jgi:hypothetical protein
MTELATKADLLAFRQELHSSLERTTLEVTHEFPALRPDLRNGRVERHLRGRDHLSGIGRARASGLRPGAAHAGLQLRP